MTRRALLLTCLLVLACSALSLAGSFVALRATSPTVRSSELGTIAFTAAPSRHARLDVYVPIVDWGVRARPYGVPLAIELQVRTLDRETAADAVRSGKPAEANIPLLRNELSEVIEHGLMRAAFAGLVGGILGGFIAGALLAAFGRSRHWLAGGAGTGLATSLACVAFFAVSLTHLDPRSFRELEFYAHGEELPRLLAFSEEVLEAGESYADSYDRALDGLTTLIAAAGERHEALPATRSLLVASDLHSNGLVLPGLEQYAVNKPVFLVGDLTQIGAEYEDEVVAGVGDLGDSVVAVSGNHDSRRFMRALAREGVVVLTRRGRLRADGSTDGQPVVTVDGLRVAGFEDPQERIEGGLASRIDLHEETLAGAQQRFLAWFESLPERPDVVLVHRHSLAHALLDLLATEQGPPLLILTGHDHEQHVDQRGRQVLVDGGTLGAGGAFGVGEERAGFIQLHLDAANKLRAADLIEVEPLSGAASARRLVFETPPPEAPTEESAPSKRSGAESTAWESAPAGS
jgi:predicted phosphodiesterase